MRFRDRVLGLRRLRPLRSLFWQGLGGTLAFLVPTAAVLLFLTVPNGPWHLVIVLIAIVIAAFLASYASYRTLGFWVGPTGIAERGFFGLRRYFPRENIGSILLVNTYAGAQTDSVPQLFVCDDAGRQLLRMRGQFWSLTSMEIVADSLEMPLTHVSDEVSMGELLDSHPGLLYWFERHPLLITGLRATGIVIVAAAVCVGWSLATGR